MKFFFELSFLLFYFLAGNFFCFSFQSLALLFVRMPIPMCLQICLANLDGSWGFLQFDIQSIVAFNAARIWHG